ncbi:hypothetical protein J1614_001090 [Plenodomus biglobosus]|nr:hypothetical protein J1614_001090 [Plenodomus biglobosus]
MSAQTAKTDTQEKVVLVVPVQHVKTVKTALEHSGQLDRSSKITVETQEIGQTEGARQDSSEPDVMGSQPSHEEASGPASSSVGSSGSTGRTQFPALQFDPVRGEYRDLAELQPSTGLQFNVVTGQYRRPADQPQIPSLQFDPESGEYSKPADTTQFPRLQFDPITGEYRDPSEEEQHPALEFDVASGQYKEQSEQLRLHFDLVGGEYRHAIGPVESSKGKGVQGQRMRIPTTIPYEPTGENEQDLKSKAELFEGLGLSNLSQAISLSHSTPSDQTRTTPAKNPLHKALKTALEEMHPTLLAPLNLTVEALLSHFPDSYSIYTPMLLLPHNAFKSPPWQTLLSAHPPDSPSLTPLWKHMASALHTTHIAVNSPIPAETPSPHPTSQPNILRSPLNITPIFGAFGPRPTPSSLSSPTPQDFTAAFWVTATQNGIHQTWAPLYTMFSRGNIKEKTRLLHLPSISTTTTTTTTATPPTVQLAADLYAGIGYFAFSYRAAGLGPILAWELNPWSIHGLQRGAALNNWRTRIVTPATLPAFEQESAPVDTDFLVFHMSNRGAGAVVARLREKGRLAGGGGGGEGAVRHVNLGLLPSSSMAWGEAVAVLEARGEGWIHAHENVGVGDVEGRRGEVEREFQRLVGELGERGVGRRVRVEHVERVKMYAPGVVHCVFDVHVSQAE